MFYIPLPPREHRLKNRKNDVFAARRVSKHNFFITELFLNLYKKPKFHIFPKGLSTLYKFLVSRYFKKPVENLQNDDNTTSEEVKSEKVKSEKAQEIFKLFHPEDYQVTFNFGFLVPDPISELPGDEFQQWNELIKELPEALKSGKIRAKIESLTHVEISVLKTYQEKRLAHTMLCHMAALYRK